MNDSNEVKLHFLDYWRVIKLRMGLIMLTFLLVVVTAGVTTYFLPKEYFSKVTMEVKQDHSGEVGAFGPNSQRNAYDPQFVATQFQILQKTEILYPVIERLELEKEFGPPGGKMSQQQVYIRLRNAMKLQELRNTGLIEIGVSDADAQRAANIANTIAVVYQEKRRQDLEKNTNRGLEELQDELEKQRKKSEDTAGLAMQIRARDGIVDSDPDKDNSNVGYTQQAMNADQVALNEQRIKVVELERQLELINGLRPDELREVLRTLNIDDQTIARNIPLLQDAITDEAKLTNLGLGVNHPRIKALEAQKEAYSKILSDQLTSIRTTQSNRLRLEKDKLSSLESQAKESRSVEIEEKAKMAEYIDAKNKQIQARKLLETMEISYEQQKMMLAVKPPTTII
jgi:uncharacterized protein involved in exopolysaccharide biosynthesis